MLRIREDAVLDFVRGVYAERESPEWDNGVLSAALRVFEDSLGTLMMTGRTDWAGPSALCLAAFRDEPKLKGSHVHWNYDDALACYRGLDGEVLEQLWGRTRGSVASVVSGIPSSVMMTMPAWRATWDAGVADAVGLVMRDPGGAMACLSIGLATESPTSPRTEALLDKLAAHFAAGMRLTAAAPDKADGVFDDRGRVLHAASEQRAGLEDGLARRAHALRSDVGAEEALDVWQGLLAGRWSLVDFIDTDGKRLVLAMKNPPRVAPRADLTQRERRVAALVAMGQRDKEIAYMLGLSLSAVTTAVRRARLKLGVRTRAELAAVWRTQC